MERKRDAAHAPANEICSRLFLLIFQVLCLIFFVMKKAIRYAAQNQDLFNGYITRCLWH